MPQVSWTLYKAELKFSTPEADRDRRPTDRLQITGYWRREAARTKPDMPVMIFTDKDAEGNPLEATVWQEGSYRPKDTVTNAEDWNRFIQTGWLHCVAVTREDYAAALKTGRWPSDNKPAREMSADEKLGIDTTSGGNNPPVEESLADQIKNLAELIAGTKEPTNKDEAEVLAGRLDKMRRLLQLAETERIREKEPFLQGGRDVDARWKAIGEPGGNAYRDGTARQKSWLRKEQARLDKEAADERDRLRKEAEDKQAKVNEQAEQMGMEPDRTPIAEPVVETKRATVGTAHGRAQGLRKVKVAKIDDLPKLVNALVFGEGGADADVIAYFQGRADKALKGGIVLPGVIVEEQLQ